MAAGPLTRQQHARTDLDPQPREVWRRVLRSRVGVAWLLPALLLAAAYVASPFSGFSTTTPVGHPAQTATAPAPAPPGATPAQADR